MNEQEFTAECRILVADYQKRDYPMIDMSEIYVVWLCKTLQNSKALLSTTYPDGMYFEVTYNGDKKEFYFDAYKKKENICIPADKN
ncbi:MAG: DUF6275 family protein [Loigolactobacillus coryniformis]|jgi:hypothetical protein|uniref:DUF6275 family protein n=1 Tax=Loigolactobacillus coryniformis TaxID=1610 RepID=UPI002649C460|nr:DUF6275 family protein [Loigolactobacillus coryniformis]MDN5953915.1 DUF6275 family protein [Loigolactobacillus coryniformis]